MRDDQRRPGSAPDEDGDTIAARYEALLGEAARAAEQYAAAPKSHRARLARRCDTLFAERIELLRQMPDFPTLDRRMPTLRAIADRVSQHSPASDAAEIARAFDGADRRPADATMRAATAVYSRLAGETIPQAQLSGDDAREFARARDAVLEAIGCRFVFPRSDAEYTNLMSLVKDDLVVRVTHDAIPSRGLPNAERISAIALSRYVDGQARGHVAAYAHGRWDTRVQDRATQRAIDEIAAAVG